MQLILVKVGDTDCYGLFIEKRGRVLNISLIRLDSVLSSPLRISDSNPIFISPQKVKEVDWIIWKVRNILV